MFPLFLPLAVGTGLSHVSSLRIGSDSDSKVKMQQRRFWFRFESNDNYGSRSQSASSDIFGRLGALQRKIRMPSFMAHDRSGRRSVSASTDQSTNSIQSFPCGGPTPPVACHAPNSSVQHCNDSGTNDSHSDKERCTSSKPKHSLYDCYNPPVVDSNLVCQVRHDLFRELAAQNSTKTVNASLLALGLNNYMIKDVVHNLLIGKQSIDMAVPKLLQILKERVPCHRIFPEASSVGILHIKCPRIHDNRIIAIYTRNLMTFAEMYSDERAISLALLQVETAFKEDVTKCVDLVVDFSNFPADGFGMDVIKKLITELSKYKGFCKRVLFVEFPEEYRKHCADWKVKLPRDFRRRVWCVTAKNMAVVLPDYYHRFRQVENPNKLPKPDTKVNAETTCKSPPPCPKGIGHFFESTDRYLIFTQWNRTEISTSTFTIRNINPDAFLVCHFAPEKSSYFVRPAPTILIPYPDKQDFVIRTQDESPTEGDKISLQVYVLRPEDGCKIPMDSEMTTVRTFLRKIPQEMILKCTCNLVVSKIEISNGAPTEEQEVDAKLFECDRLNNAADWTDADDANEPDAASHSSSTICGAQSSNGSSKVTCVKAESYRSRKSSCSKSKSRRYKCPTGNYERSVSNERGCGQPSPVCPIITDQRTEATCPNDTVPVGSECTKEPAGISSCGCESRIEKFTTCSHPIEVEPEGLCPYVEHSAETKDEETECYPDATSVCESNQAICCMPEQISNINCNKCTTSDQRSHEQASGNVWLQTEKCDKYISTTIATNEDDCATMLPPLNNSCNAEEESQSERYCSEEEITVTETYHEAWPPSVEACPMEPIEEPACLVEPVTAKNEALLEPIETLIEPIAEVPTETIPQHTNSDLSRQLPNIAKLLGLLALLWFLYMLYRQKKFAPYSTTPFEWGAPELWSLWPSKRGLKETKPSIVSTKPWSQFIWPFGCDGKKDCWGGMQLTNQFPYAQQCSEMPASRFYCSNTEHMGIFSYMACRLVEHLDEPSCSKR